MASEPELRRHPLVGPNRVTRALLDGVERDFLLAYRIGGIRTAIGSLNARTNFRITALWPLSAGMQIAPTIYDREDDLHGECWRRADELLPIARAVAHECAAIERAADWLNEPTGVASCAVVPSRVGAVVLTNVGTSWGVLFHYDLRLRLAAPNERQILEHLACRLARLCPGEVLAGRAVESAI
jgi:hypothetical protein